MASSRSASKYRGLLLIASAALAAHLALGIEPGKLPLMGWLQSADAAPLETGDDLEARIERLEHDLSAAYQELTLGEAPDGKQVKRLLADLLLESHTLELDDSMSEVARKARLAVVRAHFIAAEVLPAEFSASFRRSAAVVIAEKQGSVEAAQADALLMVHRVPSNAALDEVGIDQLVRFGKAHAGSPLGPALLCEVADKLWRNGQEDSARAVLERGLKEFAGQPRVGLIVDRLAERGFLSPVQPVLTEAVLDAARGAAGASSSQQHGEGS